MNPTIANIRGTFFTNKAVEVDYVKAMKIVTALQAYQLFPFPVNGFSFQIGPNGMIPTTLTSYEFRNNDNSLNISIGPDRIDVSQCKKFDSIEDAFSETADFCKKVMGAFHSSADFKETRLALASTWILADNNIAAISELFLQSEMNENLIEWENRRVERKLLPSIGSQINYGHKIARSQIKLPVEVALSDRLFIETDINTIPLQPDYLNEGRIDSFFKDAIEVSCSIISSYYSKL